MALPECLCKLYDILGQCNLIISSAPKKSANSMNKKRLSSISKADTLEKIGEFWDTHDFTDFDADMPDVVFDFAGVKFVEGYGKDS